MDKRIPDAAVRRAWLDHSLTGAEAAAQVGLSRVNLWMRAKRLGLPARPEGRRPVVPDDQLAVLWAANVLAREVAAIYGCPLGSVRQAARRLGFPPRPRGKHHPIDREEFRAQLMRKSQVPGQRLTDTERAILAKIRPQ